MSNIFDQLYSKEVLKHVKNPKNMGEIKDADGVATVGNPRCGDIMRLYIKVGKRKRQEYIQDIKFQTLGCGAAIATSSMVTSLVKGKPLSQAEKITKQTIMDALGGLPAIKIHCSILADDGLKKAIENYRSKKER
ncbi:iron-sulfur cluster assembly scaffold protein [Candidatus Daviesbacteria bacterium]|nr:iron-sulfur cluster assembly scaffold protein [Candidatus Daviesbacteria bacterium]